MRHTLALGTLAASVLALAFYAYTPLAAQGGSWATVKGKIVYDGTAPERPKLKIEKDQEHCLGKGDIFSDRLLVSKSGGVKNVFVWLAPADKGSKLAIHPDLSKPKVDKVEMDQPRCAFVPHAVALREGQTLVVKNSSPIPHNISYAGSNKTNPGGNYLIPSGKEQEIKLVADRLPINMSCNIHPWMTGVARVYDHPYFALTGDDGTFEIANAPVGKCLLYVWHEEVGWLNEKGKDGQPIDIGPSGFDLKEVKLKVEAK